MIFLVAFLIGGAIGWRRASARGGVMADKLQYGFAHGMAVGLLALVVQVLAFSFGVLG
ncbi:MAG: hypothetical protein AAF317_21270 [Pseudomonadota bacterium]